MIVKIFYGLIFITLFAFFVAFGYLKKTIDFAVEFVASFNSLGLFFQDEKLGLLAGMVWVLLAFAVVMSFKK